MAELIITSKTFEEDVYHWIFGGEGTTWYVVSLVIDSEKVSSITLLKTDTLNEIFDINTDTTKFDVDNNRLNYLLHKYRNHVQFIDFKKILRPIVRRDIKTINVIKKHNEDLSCI
jgi:hypothetical protein